MTERVASPLKKAININILLVVFLLPLIFTPYAYDSYTLPKLVFLRLVTLICVAAWLLKMVGEGKLSWRRSILDLPLFTLITVFAISCIFSISLSLSLFGQYKRYEGLFTLINYALLYFLVINLVVEKEQVNLLVKAFILSATIISVYGISQHFGWDFVRASEAGTGTIRSFSTLGNPVFLGAFLVMSMLVTLGFTVGQWSKVGWSMRLFLSFALAVMAVCLIFTYSRGSWVGCLIGVILFVILAGKKIISVGRSKVVLFLLVLIMAAVFAGVIFKVPLVMERVTSMAKFGGTARTRLIMWEATVNMIATRPFLGYGPDTLSLVYPKYIPAEFRLLEPGARVDKAHNEFLQVAATIGLMGLAVYLWLMLSFFWASFKALRKIEDHYRYFLLAGLLSGLIGYLIQLQFSFSQLDVAPIFWILLGLAIVAQRTGMDSKVEIKRWELWSKEAEKKLAYTMCFLLIGAAIFGFWITSIQPLAADIHYKLGATKRGEQIDSAIFHLERAAALNPREDRYYIKLGESYYFKMATSDQGKDLWFQKALEAYTQAKSLDSYDPDLYLNLGNLFNYGGQWDKGMYTKAIDVYSKAIRFNVRKSADAYNGLGVAHAQKGLVDEAIPNFKKAIEIDPKKLDAYSNLAVAYHQKGEIDKAIATIEKALRVDSNNASLRQMLRELKRVKS